MGKPYAPPISEISDVSLANMPLVLIDTNWAMVDGEVLYLIHILHIGFDYVGSFSYSVKF